MWVLAADDEHADEEADYIADDVDQTGRQADEVDVEDVGAIFTGRLEWRIQRSAGVEAARVSEGEGGEKDAQKGPQSVQVNQVVLPQICATKPHSPLCSAPPLHRQECLLKHPRKATAADRSMKRLRPGGSGKRAQLCQSAARPPGASPGIYP